MKSYHTSFVYGHIVRNLDVLNKYSSFDRNSFFVLINDFNLDYLHELAQLPMRSDDFNISIDTASPHLIDLTIERREPMENKTEHT